MEQPQEIAPTLAALIELGSTTVPLPPAEVACARCPTSMWYRVGNQVSCYCRVMYLIAWQSGMAIESSVTLCDSPLRPPPTNTSTS